MSFYVPKIYFARFSSALFIVGSLIILLEYGGSYFVNDSNPWKIGVLISIYLVTYTVFAVTCHRIIILGPNSVPKYGIGLLGKREWKFFAWMAGGYIVFYLVLKGLSQISFSLISGTDLSILLHLPMSIGLLICLYVFSRLSPLFPATAVDSGLSLKKTFDLTRGNGFRLVFIVMIFPLLFEIATGWIPEEYMITKILVSIFGLALFVIEIAALSLSYKYLVDHNDYLLKSKWE